MPDQTKPPIPETAAPPASVRDRAIRPSGLLPKNAQAYVILTITVIMVGAIAFSGGSPKSATPAATQKSAPVTDPNLARIQEYRNRIDEEARKLASEQAELQQAKQALGMPPASSPNAVPTQPIPVYPARESLETRPEKTALAAEKEKREYESLFASNIALTYRKEGDSATRPASPAANESHSTSAAQPMPIFYPWPYPAGNAPSPAVSQPSANPGIGKPGETASRSLNPEPAQPRTPEHTSIDPSLQRAEGKKYRLLEGTLIETALINRLDGSFNGPVNCLVTTDVYSHDLQHLLIPKGSRILGEVQRNDRFGQRRLAVFFHRLIMPDGYSVSLDQFKGLNQIGETGSRDKVNHHYTQIFGVSLAIGALAGLSNLETGYGVNATSLDAYRQGVAANLSQNSLNILDRYLNVLPTFTIREGYRIKVFLSNDLLLPAYDQHTLPADL
jgi:type IV secretory pathway VirB10-like protein